MFQFIEVVKDAEENDGDREKLLKKLNKNYASAHRNYTMSAEFRQLLQKSIKKIKADKVMLYHMVKDVLEKLKSSKVMKNKKFFVSKKKLTEKIFFTGNERF